MFAVAGGGYHCVYNGPFRGRRRILAPDLCPGPTGFGFQPHTFAAISLSGCPVDGAIPRLNNSSFSLSLINVTSRVAGTMGLGTALQNLRVASELTIEQWCRYARSAGAVHRFIGEHSVASETRRARRGCVGARFGSVCKYTRIQNVCQTGLTVHCPTLTPCPPANNTWHSMMLACCRKLSNQSIFFDESPTVQRTGPYCSTTELVARLPTIDSRAGSTRLPQHLQVCTRSSAGEPRIRITPPTGRRPSRPIRKHQDEISVV